MSIFVGAFWSIGAILAVPQLCFNRARIFTLRLGGARYGNRNRGAIPSDNAHKAQVERCLVWTI
jgi:hypothetical protein